MFHPDRLAEVMSAVEAHLQRSARSLTERRFEDAAAAARHAIALAPLDLRGRRALALALAAREAQSEVVTRIRRRADSEAADPQELAARAEALFRAGDLHAAERMLRAAIRRAPGQERFCVMLADVLNRQGRPEQAVEVLHELIAVPTLDPHVHARLGHIQLQCGKLGEAEAAFRAAAEMAPDVEGFGSLLAEVLHRQGRNTDAAAILRNLVAQPARDAQTYSRYGRVLIQLGELAGAEAAMRSATELQPEADGFHNTLADVLNRRGERAEALKILRQLVGKPTPDPHIHAHLGRVLAQEGDLVGAEAAFCRAAEIDPSVEGFRGAQADVVHRQGRHADAMAILQGLVARPTRDPHVHARYGTLLMQAGDLPGAEAAMRAAITLDPGVDGFHNALADVRNRRGERAEALRILRDLVSKPTRDAPIHAHLGRMLAQDGDLAGAGAAFCRAAELDPAVEEFRAAQADVLDRQGSHETALAILRDLAAKPTRDPHIHSRLGHALLRMGGDLTEAESAFRSAVALAPEAEAFRSGLADVLARRGQHHEAVGILRDLVGLPGSTAHCCGQLGRLLLQRGDLADAEEALREAIERDRGAAEFHSALADVLEQQGRRAEAICVLQEAGRTLRDAPIHARVAQMLAEERDFTGAAAAWRHAVELRPDNADFVAALEKVTAQIASRPLAQAAADEGLPREKPVQGAAPPVWRLLRLALGAVAAKQT
jgi:Flp pilus assembly protein TadD